MIDLTRAVEALRDGRVVAAPTESSYGLFADAKNPRALDLLFSLKPKASGQAVALVAPSGGSWRALVGEVPPLAARLARAFWPGPLTIAVRPESALDPRLLQRGTVGVRVPGPCCAATLCRLFGGALTATSANAPGEEPALKASEVKALFASAVARKDLVVIPGSAPGGKPSTVVVVVENKLEVAREGAISRFDIECAGLRDGALSSSSPPAA